MEAGQPTTAWTRSTAAPAPTSSTGGLGPDYLVGGPGDDVYAVSQGNETVVEAPREGTDLLSMPGGSLPPSVEDLILMAPAAGVGNALDNILTGTTGADTLTGAAGHDPLRGGLRDLRHGGNGPHPLDRRQRRPRHPPWGRGRRYAPRRPWSEHHQPRDAAEAPRPGPHRLGYQRAGDRPPAESANQDLGEGLRDGPGRGGPSARGEPGPGGSPAGRDAMTYPRCATGLRAFFSPRLGRIVGLRPLPPALLDRPSVAGRTPVLLGIAGWIEQARGRWDDRRTRP